MKKFFLYIRKSTDEDNRQVLSLEAQEFELNFTQIRVIIEYLFFSLKSLQK